MSFFLKSKGASMEMEEYRQPWESGRYWELKKDFLKFYKDFFPEDRLLCLAQVYSNIELLQCSYPTQVMTQIQKLARHLKANKNGNGSKILLSESQSTKRSKRKNQEPDSSKVQNFQKPKEKSTNKSNYEESLPPGLDSVDYKSIAQSENFDLVEKLAVEVQKLLKLQQENAYDIILSAALHLNIEDLIDFQYTNISTDSESERYFCEFFIGKTKLAIGGGENRYLAKKKSSENALNTLSNLPLIQKLGVEVEKLLDTSKCRKALDIMLTAALRLGVEDLIILKVSTQTIQGTKADYTYARCHCDFFIGATKMASAEGLKKCAAKRIASDKALYIITHLRDLPKGDLEQVRVVWWKQNLTGPKPDSEPLVSQLASKSSSHSKWDRELLEKMAFEVKRECTLRDNCSSGIALTVMFYSFDQLKRSEDLVYNAYRDVSVMKGHPQYICDALVNNIPMAQGKALSKRKAQIAAANSLMQLFLDLFERKRKSTDPFEDIYADVILLIDKHSQEATKYEVPILKYEKSDDAASICSNSVEMSNNKNEKQSHNNVRQILPDNITSGNKEVKDSRNPPSINKRLYNNSIKQNLLLFDRSDIPGDHKQTHSSELSYSINQCRRVLSCQYALQIDDSFKCDILLDNQILGSGVARTRRKSKEEAARLILEKLQKEIYTIKIKMNDEENFVINPDDLAKLRFETPKAASEKETRSKKSWSIRGREKKRCKIICPGNENFARLFKYYADFTRYVSLSSMKCKIETLLAGYRNSDAVAPLVFSPDFLKPERAIIMRFERKFGLARNKYQRAGDRNLYIRRKVSVKEFLDLLIKSGGRTQKYELVDETV